MATHVSRFFRQRRQALDLSLGELARRLGYQNVAKGANRIQRFEQEAEIPPDLFDKLTEALGITPAEIHDCVERDRAEWNEWADEPIEPHLVVRAIPGVYIRKAIPSDLHHDREAMEQFASEFLQQGPFTGAYLVLSRRNHVLFDREGRRAGVWGNTFERSFYPSMSLGRGGARFLFGSSD